MVGREREQLVKPLPQAYKVFRMRTLSLDVITRLVVGAVLNVVLLLMLPRLAMWRSLEQEFWTAFIAGSVGILAIGCLVPILWRGKTWQPVAAIVLMVGPVLSFYFPIDFLLQYK